jgi:hypothetical protein
MLIGAVGLTAGGAVGCAQERAPINRVQPNALSKSFFVGDRLQDPSDDPEFWTQGTLVDVGYGASQDGLFTSTYAQPASRMKWVIQEDLLVGRLTYERIKDTDGKGAGKATNDGVIVVAYPILGHFDIRRDYNPTTGEESNVIVENQNDRPWYEREYMRVDWSRNLNVDSYELDTLSMVGIYGGVTYESLAYYVNDPTSEDAPHFDPESGYFDVTNKAFATPQIIDLSHLGWGIDKFPACWLDPDFAGGTAPSANCNPVELTIRQSFRRVVDKDYEPADWDGHRFKAYGAFTDDRHGYARNYGMSDQKWHRFISRYNIWQRSHFYADPENMTGAVECFTPTTTPPDGNPHRDVNKDGTEDECQTFNDAGEVTGFPAGAGARCDTFAQKCTLPYRNRTPAPQVWYYTDKSNREFFDGTEWATHEWDVALRVAVQSAKYAECITTFDPNADDVAKKTSCSQQYPIYFGQQDQNFDAIQLSREVDDCRLGKGDYAGKDCNALADELGAQRGYDPGVIAVAKMPEMVVLCHSPVEHNDPAACGEKRLPKDVTQAMCEQARKDMLATDEPSDDLSDLAAACSNALTVRMGDLRYHQVNVMTAPQTPSPWGIMTDTEDPLTGEKIAGSINVWSHVNDLFSQGVIDTVRYLKGELTTEEVTEGTFVKNWAQASESAAQNGVMPGMTEDEVNERIANFAGMDPKEIKKIQLDKAARGVGPSAAVQAVRKELRATKADVLAPSSNRAMYDARRKHAVGSEFEAKLASAPMMQQFAGIERLPGQMAMEVASPLRGGNASVQRDLRHMKEVALAERGACIMYEAAAPLATAGLADELERKFEKFNPDDTEAKQMERAERMRKYIAQRAHYAVIIHEMGHSIGLRHNFVSSSDAFGFRPQYWQLRTKDGSIAKKECTGVTDGEDCVGPRYFDPVTKNERDNMVWMFMQSSVMDYAGETTQDLLGLGAYDFAATRMFYGESVAVFDDPKFSSKKSLGKAVLDKMDQFGGLLGIQYTTNGQQVVHYSKLQDAWNLIQNCQPIADPTVFKPKSWNDERDGAWSPLLDGLLVRSTDTNGDGTIDETDQYTRCSTQPVDYVQWQAMGPEPKSTDDFSARPKSVDASNRTRVPYGFATDRWADLGNIAVYRHDNGADPYEQFSFFITQQEVGHIFDNYRRNRNSFSVRNAANRILGRYSEKMRDGAKGLALLRNIYTEFALEIGDSPESWWADIVVDPSFRDVILASGVVFDHFTRQMARPEPGPYYLPCELNPNNKHLCPANDGTQVLRSKIDTYFNADAVATQVIIPNGATGFYENVGIGGKPLGNALAADKGEYDSEYTINAGSYYDKVYTSMLMTESVDNFISDSRKDFLDSRYRATSLADLFPEGYRRWLANNLTGDDYIKGPRVTANGVKPLIEADKFAKDPMGWTSWWKKSGPEVCFPANGTTVCSRYGEDGNPFNANAPQTMAIDGQVGWEQQKFLIAWTLMYLPENAKQEWLNMLNIWERTEDTDPVFQNRIEFHDPNGKVFVAKTFGTETIFGKTVQIGVGARILEFANQLLSQAYETTTVTNNGVTWYVPVIDPATGAPRVKKMYADDTDGKTACSENAFCVQLQGYTEIPFFMRQALQAYGLADPSMKGLYE